MTTGPEDATHEGTVPARIWYARQSLAVARDLLGACLTVRSAEGDVTIRLTEVEAYGGADDPASHAFRGRNSRNAAMFAEPGRLYVYRHLGLQHCLNVVTAPSGEPSAVLLRAGEVVETGEICAATVEAGAFAARPSEPERQQGEQADDAARSPTTPIGVAITDAGVTLKRLRRRFFQCPRNLAMTLTCVLSVG